MLKRRDIQGLRGLAVVLVVLYHTGLPVRGGFIGVDVFFVISGFVITNLLVTELRLTGTIRLRRFYARRVRRLLPALALVLAFVLVASIFLLSPFGPQQVTAKTASAAALSVANLYMYRGTGNYFADVSKGNPLLHTWSLSVEEQFYLVFPALLLVAWSATTRLGKRRDATAGVAIVLVVVGTASLALSALTGLGFLSLQGRSTGSLRILAFYGSPFRAWEFVAGALLVFALPALGKLSARAEQVLSLAGLGLVLWAAFSYSSSTVLPGTAAIVPVAGTVMLLAAGTSTRRTFVAGPFSSRAAVWVGDLSYSWYLWHWPAIVFVEAVWPETGWLVVPAGLLSLLPAYLSYNFLEQPIRSGGPWPGRRILTLVVVSLAIPFALAVVVTQGASRTWGLKIRSEFADRRLALGCTDTSPGDFPAATCTWRVERAKGTIVVLGDSHATSVSDGAVAAGNALGYDVAVWAKSGCPFLARPTYAFAACADFQRRSLALTLADADLVVIANRSPGYTLPPVGDGSPQIPWLTISTADGSMPSSQDAALESWAEGLEGVMRPLEGAGIPVVVFETVPEYPVDFSRRVSLLRPVPPSVDMTRAYVDERRGAVLAVEEQVVARHANATTFDAIDVLCGPTRCSPGKDGHFIYMDRSHLNPDGSRLIGPALQRAFSGALGLS